MKKKLYKSQTDKVFAGVVGGLADYFDVDVTLLRLIWMVIVVFTGIFPGVIAYILAALIMPKETVPASSDEINEANEEYKKIV